MFMGLLLSIPANTAQANSQLGVFVAKLMGSLAFSTARLVFHGPTLFSELSFAKPACSLTMLFSDKPLLM